MSAMRIQLIVQMRECVRYINVEYSDIARILVRLLRAQPNVSVTAWNGMTELDLNIGTPDEPLPLDVQAIAQQITPHQFDALVLAISALGGYTKPGDWTRADCPPVTVRRALKRKRIKK